MVEVLVPLLGVLRYPHRLGRLTPLERLPVATVRRDVHQHAAQRLVYLLAGRAVGHDDDVGVVLRVPLGPVRGGSRRRGRATFPGGEEHGDTPRSRRRQQTLVPPRVLILALVVGGHDEHWVRVPIGRQRRQPVRSLRLGDDARTGPSVDAVGTDRSRNVPRVVGRHGAGSTAEQHRAYLHTLRDRHRGHEVTLALVTRRSK